MTNNVVAEGDLNSDEKGSGARMNAGKTPWELIPLRQLREWWDYEYDLVEHYPSLDKLLVHLIGWQMRQNPLGLIGAWRTFPFDAREDVAKVLEYGSKKYKAWNWAKGQRWGCTLGSLLRHAEKILQGEQVDQESGLPHWGHIGCNLLFLVWFQDQYPEGDDRPPVYSNSEGLAEAFENP